MMRLMLLVLLVVCVGVCFCRPEGADAPYEDTCEEGDEVCYYLARLNQGHDDDGDDDGGDGDVSSVESSHEGNGDSNNDEQHMDGLGRMDPLDSGEGRGMTGEYVAGEMVMESGKDINGRSGDMRSEEEDEEDMDEEDYLRTTVDGDDEGENEETTTHPSTSSPTSPTGPPTSRQKQYSAEGDKTTKSTYVSTSTQPPTTTETPTGPPAPDLARQGPKGVSLRRPRPGPFPTPFREPR